MTLFGKKQRLFIEFCWAALRGVGCFLIVTCSTLALATAIGPYRSLLQQFCWLSLHSYTKITTDAILIDNLLAPIVESGALIFIYYTARGSKAANIIVFIFALIFHGISISSPGKAIAFLFMYQSSSTKLDGEIHKSLMVFGFRILITHVVWNLLATLFPSVGLILFCVPKQMLKT